MSPQTRECALSQKQSLLLRTQRSFVISYTKRRRRARRVDALLTGLHSARVDVSKTVMAALDTLCVNCSEIKTHLLQVPQQESGTTSGLALSLCTYGR